MRIDDNIDTHLSKQQFGFRKNRGTVDGYFQKRAPVPAAFKFSEPQGCIRRGALWKMLRSIRVDYKTTSLIETMYDNVECHQLSTDRMVHSGNRSETGLFVITYPVPFVPGVRYGRFEERVQRVHSFDANPNEHSDYGFGKQMNTGDSARDVSVVTSHEFRAALTTGHNQWMVAERV